MKNFIGRDGFIWWIGRVVDLNDPLSLGRCRVRIFGYHGEEKDIPDDDLPWAVAIHPINTPNFYGTPRIGYFVFGFFLDAISAQEPAMLGYFPGAPSEGEVNFTNISSKEDVLLDINGAKISISNTGVVRIESSNNIIISSNSDVLISGNNITLTSTTSTVISGKILELRDSANTYTPSTIKSKFDELDETNIEQNEQIELAKTLPEIEP
jgi:hypothetical protein